MFTECKSNSILFKILALNHSKKVQELRYEIRDACEESFYNRKIQPPKKTHAQGCTTLCIDYLEEILESSQSLRFSSSLVRSQHLQNPDSHPNVENVILVILHI